MKLPRNFPALEEPKFILANPVWLQISVLLLSATFSLFGVYWAVHAYLSSTAHFYHYFAVVISIFGLSGAAYSRNWRRWVSFAADAHGVYFSNIHGDFTFIPWDDVGESSIGVVGGFENRHKTVILKIKVDKNTFEKILGGRVPNLLKSFVDNIDHDGYRSIGIGNVLGNVSNLQKDIELLRSKRSPHEAKRNPV